MAYFEDMKKVFRLSGELSSSHELRMVDRSLAVFSGHRGLALLSPCEIVVKVRRGRVRLFGEGLRLVEASPSEVYVQGRIDGVEYLG